MREPSKRKRLQSKDEGREGGGAKQERRAMGDERIELFDDVIVLGVLCAVLQAKRFD